MVGQPKSLLSFRMKLFSWFDDLTDGIKAMIKLNE